MVVEFGRVLSCHFVVEYARVRARAIVNMPQDGPMRFHD